MNFKYRKGQELPAMTFDALDRAGDVMSFTGWTATATYALATAPNVALADATTVTLATSSPNTTISPAVDEWDALTANAEGTRYVIHITYTRTSDGFTMEFGDPDNPPDLILFPAVTPVGD